MQHLLPSHVGVRPHPATAAVYSVAADHEESGEKLAKFHPVGSVVVWIAHAARFVAEHPAVTDASVGP